LPEADYYLTGIQGGRVSDLVPREKVTQQGVRAVGGLAGGVGLFVVAALVDLIPVVGGLGSALLKVGGIGLLGLGGYNLYQFIRNLRRRM
jgi:hypothetical protein